MIIYKVEKDGKIWVELDSLLKSINSIKFGGFRVGEQIAERIELVILRDRAKK